MLEYSKEVNNPYMTDAAQIFQEYLLGSESEDFIDGLKAFSDGASSVEFITR